MTDILRSWLEQDAGIYSSNLEEDFSSGYLLGMVLAKHNMQPDFASFKTETRPSSMQANFALLKPALQKLGVKLDAGTAQAIISKQRGVATKVLYEVKQALAELDKNAGALDHAGFATRQVGVATAPTAQLLEAQQHRSQQLAYQMGTASLFEDILRKHGESPNRLLESFHQQRFTDEGARQAAEATDALFESRRSQKQKELDFRSSLQDKLNKSRGAKAAQLQHDGAVHAALLRRKGDIEREELRVELAMQHLTKQRQQDQKVAAAADAACGIDAFEMTLKRLGGGGSSGGGGEDDTGAGGVTGDTGGLVTGVPPGPLETLNRLKTLAPSLNQLQEDSSEYMARIKAQRSEDLNSRKEREARRRRLVAEQAGAREAAAARGQEASLLEGLVRRSAEEAALAQRLWQLRQEKAAMEENRKLREQQYAAQKDKEWQSALLREQELHRQLSAQYAAEAAAQRAAWQEAQAARAAAKAAKHAALGREVAWQLVQLAERMVGYRGAAAGAAVPRKDWRQWVAMFTAGDPALGTPIVSTAEAEAATEEPADTAAILNQAELQEYLHLTGEWSPANLPIAATPEPPAAPAAAPTGAKAAAAAAAAGAAAAAAAAAAATAHGGKAGPAAEQLGAVVADLALLASEAARAEAAVGDGPVAPKLSNLPLRLAVVGGPLSGKTTVAQNLASRFKLKLLSPEALLAEAIAASQRPPELPDTPASGASSGKGPAAGAGSGTAPLPPGMTAAAAAAAAAQAAADAEDQRGIAEEKARLGGLVQQYAAAGNTVPDELLVQLVVLGMREALYYMGSDSRPGESGGSAGGKGKGAGRPGSKEAATKPAAAAAPAAKGAAGAAAGAASAQGFVLDGYPATFDQAVLLEKALTGLDLASEEALAAGASLVAPPPASKLPVLQRPLVSGLSAVVVLGGVEEGAATARALGRRRDPMTGTIYHLDWDPPPKTSPGLVERLTQLPEDQQQASVLTHRLTTWQDTSPRLLAWLSRFQRLKRPVDAAAELPGVLGSAGDVAGGLLRAMSAVSSAKGAAEAAAQAAESAHRAKGYAQAAQGHAEAAARELLAAKRAEIAASGLLTGGKNPDPAAAEVLKVQAAAKCADQLKVCRSVAADAGSFADRAAASAGLAVDAVGRCKRALGDAEVSAEAEAAAKKAADEAQVASNSAADAANKAAAAKQLAEAYVREAEQWAGAHDVPATASIPGPAAVAAAEGLSLEEDKPTAAEAATEASAAAAAADAAAAASSSGAAGEGAAPQPPQLQGELGVVQGMAAALHRQWQQLEASYLQGLGAGFAGVRQARGLALGHMQMCGQRFRAYLQRGHTMQAAVQSFVERFNAVDQDLRSTKEAQGELLLRCEELRDALWATCDARQEAAEAERSSLAADPATVEHVGLLGQQYAGLVQVELDRCLSTANFLYMFSFAAQGAPLPSPLPELCAVPSSVVTASIPPELKDRLEGKGAPPPPPYVAPLANKAPILATSLRLAAAVAAAVQTRVGQLAEEAAAGGDVGGKKGGKGSAPAAAAAAAAKPAAGGKGAAAGGKGAPAAAVDPAAAAATAASLEAEAKAAAATAAAFKWLQQELSSQVHGLQQRLALLAAKATASIDEMLTGQAAVNNAMGQWQQQAYIAECSAVAALEQVVKAAAVSGQPLSYDLRLEDHTLVVDETQLLVAPASPPPPPPAVPTPPSPGLLTHQQLLGLVGQLAAAAPAGMLRVPAAVELLMAMAAAGELPAAWRALDASHLLSSLSAFDPVDCGYLDWRELVIAFIAASYPELTKSTAADMAGLAAQAVAAAAVLSPASCEVVAAGGPESSPPQAAAGSGAGPLLQRPSYNQLRWWFEPKEPLEEGDAAAEQLAAAAARATELKGLLWEVFAAVPLPRTSSSASMPGSRMASAGGAPGAAATAAAASALDAPPSPGSGGGVLRANFFRAGSWRGSEAGAVMPGAGEGLPVVAPPPAEPVADMASLLLYACADADQYVGIQKAVAVVCAQQPRQQQVPSSSKPRVLPEQVVRIAYPLPQHLQAASGDAGRTLLLSEEQVVGCVQRAAAAAAAARTAAAMAASVPGVKGGAGSGKEAAAAAAVEDTKAITAEQLMYGEACERVVSLLMGRYQLRDVYTAARL